MSVYSLEYRCYQRSFKQPLKTHHGIWSDRPGILLRLTDPTGKTGFGEIAPLEWFGSESFASALTFCQRLGATLTPAQIFSVPHDLPACQFGLESAWESVGQESRERLGGLDRYSVLLPAGVWALEAWRSPWETGVRTFKWKIGVAPIAQELEEFARLIQILPGSAKLRLDANGGLDFESACRWLEACSQYPQVEFLEQPLPVSQFEAMRELSDRFSTPIALDESVATLQQLEDCYQQGWRGIFVVKPAIAGSPRRLRQFCQQSEVDVVWSSVFETAIARKYIEARLVAPLTRNARAIGFGITQWFGDNTLDQPDPEHLWQSL